MSPAPNALPGLPSTVTDDLEMLREKLHGGTNAVVPFVGSGLSRPGLDSWWQLLKSLIDRADPRSQAELNDLLTKDKFLDVATLLESDPTIGKPIISQTIQRKYRRPKAARPAVYDLVASLPTRHFLTTNYDPWLKDAVSAHVGSPRVYIPTDPGALTEIDPVSPPLVLMLHGDADRAEHCVLSARAYRTLQHGMPAFRKALAALAGQRSFLFLGYSLSDQNIIAVLDEWAEIFAPDGAPPRHVLLDASLSRIQRKNLLDRSVLPVEYSPGNPRDHSALPTILRWLANAP